VICMGRVRTKDIKDLARDLHEIHKDKFSGDFESNKAALNEMGIVKGRSKKFRNRVAGYVVRVSLQKPRK